MVYLIKLLPILSFGAFCALDAEAQEERPANSFRSQKATFSGNAGGTEDENSQNSVEGTEEGADGFDEGELSEASAQQVVAEGPPSPLNENFAEYLQSLLEEINAKAAESRSAAEPEETAPASIFQGEEEEEVLLTEVVEGIAEVLASTVPEPQVAETYAQNAAAGNTSTTTSSASPSTASDASSPFRLITTLGLAVISAAATLLVAI